MRDCYADALSACAGSPTGHARGEIGFTRSLAL